MTQLSAHFSLDELVASQTAARMGIDNTPPPEVLTNLGTLCDGLELIRTLLGHPLIISSGYRSPKLNAAVGGVGTSAHCFGYAADFICPAFGTPFQIASKILASGIKFDQLIMEYTWTHCSFDPQLRRQPLTLLKGGRYKQGISDG